MTVLGRLILFICLLTCNPMILMAKEIKYNHNSKTISEIQKEVDFKVLAPKKVPADWTLDTKTSPWISLHYMDSDDTKMMIGIDLRREFPLSDEDFPHSQKVDINGNKGYFQAWAESREVDKNGDPKAGGILNWVQDGTFIEMISFSFSKEKMLEICKVNEIK